MISFPIFKKTAFLLVSIFSIFACQSLFPEEQIVVDPIQSDLETSTPVPDQPQPRIVDVVDSIGDPFSPELGNTGYDVEHYTLQLSLDPAKPYAVEGTVTIEVLVTTQALEQIVLDFIGFEISSLTVNNEGTEFTRPGNKLIAQLPQILNQNETATLVISYSGQAVREQSIYVPFESQIGLFYPESESLYVLSEPDGSRYWFPNNDHPRDKATFRFEINVPAGLTAVANGQLIENKTLANGEELFIWEHNFPMSSYLATVAIAEYNRIESSTPSGVPIRHYTFPDIQPNFEEVVSVTGEALEWMSELFGPYPFEVIGFVTVVGEGASLENQTIVILDQNMVRENVIVHELVHMWFGNWVGLDSWGEMWRNEGFATYFEILWEFRDDPSGLEIEMNRVNESIDNSPELQPLNGLSPGNLFSYETYVKGAAVVHALREEIGDEAFFDGLRTYLDRFGGGTASNADFQAVMEEVSGKSLDDFFEKWLTN